MVKTRKTLPRNETQVSFAPGSLNREARTLDVVWTTGARGFRTAWGERYWEELSLDPKHVDLSRLNDGSHPLLAAHDSNSLDAVIGVVEKVRLENGKASATVRFAKDEISNRVFEKVADGILKNISVGYSVEKYEETTQDGDDYATLLATRWTPMELSIVPIGFDKNAKVRASEVVTENEVEIIKRAIPAHQPNGQSANGESMSDDNKQPSVASQIRKMVRESNLSESFALDLIENNVSLAEATRSIATLAKYAKEQEATPVSSVVTVEVGTDSRDKQRDGFTDALASKMDQTIKPTEAARQFMGQDLLRMSESYLGGRRLYESNYQLATRAMSTSDFPLILSNAANKVAQNRYELAPKSFLEWSSVGKPLKDFKSASLLRAGDHGSLVKKLEGGEYKHSSFSEQNESVQLSTYGNIHSFTREALVNDDLSMLSQVASEGGVASARLEESLVYEQLISNPTMGDGYALFSSQHSNLPTGAAISVNSIGEAIKLMRKQTSVDGRDVLNIAPAFMICGPDSEQLARQYLAQVNPVAPSDVNPWSSSMKLIISGEILTNDYYFACAPNAIPTVQRFYLDGQQSPHFESKVDFATDSVLLKVRFDVAAAVVDWRGLIYQSNAS